MDIEDIITCIRKIFGVKIAITKNEALHLATEDYISINGKHPRNHRINQDFKTINIAFDWDTRGGNYHYIIDVQGGSIVKRWVTPM